MILKLPTNPRALLLLLLELLILEKKKTNNPRVPGRPKNALTPLHTSPKIKFLRQEEAG